MNNQSMTDRNIQESKLMRFLDDEIIRAVRSTLGTPEKDLLAFAMVKANTLLSFKDHIKTFLLKNKE